MIQKGVILMAWVFYDGFLNCRDPNQAQNMLDYPELLAKEYGVA